MFFTIQPSMYYKEKFVGKILWTRPERLYRVIKELVLHMADLT